MKSVRPVPRPLRFALPALLLALSACHNPLRTGPEPSVAERLSDARAAGLALSINNVEIGYALLVPTRAADPDVVLYGARMHTDHTALNATLTDLLARLDLPAEDEPTGTALRDASLGRRDRLRALTGRAFDAAYVDADLASHRELLRIIDDRLAPGTSRRELREYVAALRPAIAAHLAHAEQLQATLAARRR